MKINRINVFIDHNKNKHLPYLNNHILDLMKVDKFGGQFGNDFITLNGMPENLLKVLENLKIKFRRY